MPISIKSCNKTGKIELKRCWIKPLYVVDFTVEFSRVDPTRVNLSNAAIELYSMHITRKSAAKDKFRYGFRNSRLLHAIVVQLFENEHLKDNAL